MERTCGWNETGEVTPIAGLPLDGQSEARDASWDGSIVLGQDSPFFVSGSEPGGFVWDATNGARSIAALSGYSGRNV